MVVNHWESINPEKYITCYIYNLITNEKIIFKTTPEGVTESYQASWSSQEVLGRSAPYLAYNNNSARTADYSVLLDRNIMGDPDYLKTIDQCKRLVYPKYTGGGLVIPPYCYVRFGGMLKMFAIVESVNVSWSGVFLSSDDSRNNFSTSAGGDPNKNVLSQCEVSFSFQEIRTRGQLIPTGQSLNEREESYR